MIGPLRSREKKKQKRGSEKVKYRIGIDLGGTNIATGVVDEQGKITAKMSVPTKAKRPAAEILEDCARTVETLICQQAIEKESILSVGMGVPGTANQETGCMEDANNFQDTTMPVIPWLKERLDMPVYFDNDANAAALGEYEAGAGKGASSMLMMTLGTGIGGAIIIDGKVYQGCNGASGEWGHMVIDRNGPLCSCGRKGCFESMASASALVRQVKEAMDRDKQSLLWKLCQSEKERVNGKLFFDAVRQKDPLANEVFQTYIRTLGEGTVNLINIFQPEILCIGGGISQVGDLLLKPLEDMVKAERYTQSASKQTEIRQACLGNDAGIIGAAFLGQ